MERKKSFLKRSLFFFTPFRKWLLIVVGMMLFGQIIGTFSPYLFGKGVDAITHSNIHITIFFLCIAFLLALLQSEILGYIREQIEIKRLDFNIEKDLSVKALERIYGFSIGQHTNEHSGVKQSIVSRGQNSLTQLMYNLLYNVLPGVLQILATLGILYFFDWKVAAVATAFSIIYILISYRRNITFFPKAEEVRKKNQAQSKLQSELYRNSTLVIAESQEEKTVAEFETSYNETVSFAISTWSKYLNTVYIHKVLLIVGQYATLALGIYFILIGKHSAGMFIAFYSWTNSIFNNLMQVMNSQRQLLFQIVEIRKYFNLLDIKPDIDPNLSGHILPNLQGEIEFSNVSFAYPYRQSAREQELEIQSDKTEDHAISNINFKIPAGAKVGFVGISGSGKTTIVNLMRRFYDPTSGEILIDGVNLKDFNLHWLRSRIGNVEQKIDLFDRSIRDNILFGLPADQTVSEEKLQKAVDDASLTEFIAKLKDHGLNTVIGEGGIKVSGGERQRIGIARALIKDPKILIFDEATSALDSINEKLIHEAINRSAEGRTTIMIAHRLSTVMDADIIFVVANGKVVDSGKHEELKNRCMEYQELIKNQIF